MDASVSPEVARMILRDRGQEYVALMSRLEGMGGSAALWQAGELRRSLQSLSGSVRLLNLIQAGRGSADTASEVRKISPSEDLAHPPSESGISPWVSGSEVATRAGVSVGYIDRLCRDKVLVAAKAPTRGRPWRIDPESAAEWIEDRSKT